MCNTICCCVLSASYDQALCVLCSHVSSILDVTCPVHHAVAHTVQTVVMNIVDLDGLYTLQCEMA